MKPKLKPPGIKRLKVKCSTRLSTSAFKFSLRRYSMGVHCHLVTGDNWQTARAIASECGIVSVHAEAGGNPKL